MNHVSERLASITQIKHLLADLEKAGLWKSVNIPDQATIEDTKDEILRILNLIETELERTGLWDRAIRPDNKSQDDNTDQTCTLDQIAQRAAEAKRCLDRK